MSRNAFTMVELLAVIGIVLLLAGLALPAWKLAMRSAGRARTQAAVDAVAAAMQAYDGGRRTWQSRSSGVISRMWDVDEDGLVDGVPATLAGPWAARAAADGYQGFLAMSGLSLPKESLERGGTGRIVDAWARPLRISFATGPDDATYGPAGFGVWSFGHAGPAAGDPAAPAEPAAVIASWKGR